MKFQNKGPRMRLKLNVALHFGNVLFPRPIIKQEAKFLMNIGNHQAQEREGLYNLLGSQRPLHLEE